MKIDAHQHFWKYDPETHAWIDWEMASIRKDFLPGDLLPLLIKNEIDGSVVVQVDQHEQENENLLRWSQSHDFIKGIVGWVDLRASNLDETLQRYKRFPLIKGFRHIVQAEPSGFLVQPTFIAGVNKLAQHDFSYDLLIYHHQLPEALVFLRQVPGVRIVVDHLAKPWIRTGEIRQWASDIAKLSTFENVYCKLSGMVTEANWKQWEYAHFEPYLDQIFNCFGTERIMYGSDWPVCLVAANYDQQLAIVQQYVSRLTESEKRSVLGGNAKRFYNL